MSLKTRNKTFGFLMLTFSLSYVSAALFKLIGFDSKNSLSITILGIIYMFFPAISVFVIKKIFYKEDIKQDLMVSFKLNKWFIVAWLMMPFTAFFTALVSLLIIPETSFSHDMTGMIDRFRDFLTPEQIEETRKSMASLPISPLWLTLLEGLVAGITVNAIAAFGEELGWRGFLLRQFSHMKFYKASLIIGFLWGIWHAPLILMGHNYPQHPETGVFMMTILCILLTFLFLFITIKARSVIASSVMHGTLNATAGISIMMVNGGNDLSSGITGYSGFISLTILIFVVFLYDNFISREKIFLKTISHSINS